jgi:hypothetical protein
MESTPAEMDGEMHGTDERLPQEAVSWTRNRTGLIRVAEHRQNGF